MNGKIRLKDGRLLYDLCKDRKEYMRVYAYMVRHHLTADQAVEELAGHFGKECTDDEERKKRRATLLVRNLETQMDIFFNKLCAFDEIANELGDPVGTLNKLKKEIRETITTIINIGDTNSN